MILFIISVTALAVAACFEGLSGDWGSAGIMAVIAAAQIISLRAYYEQRGVQNFLDIGR